MGFVARFFRPWSDDNNFLLFVQSFLILGPNAIFSLYLITRFLPKFGAVTNFAQFQTVMEQFVLLGLFTAFIWIVTVVYALDFVFDKTKRFHEAIEGQGLGKSVTNAALSLVIGGFVGAFLVFLAKYSPGFGASIAASISPPSIDFGDAFLKTLYTKFFSPVFEEYFFRGALMPTLIANSVIRKYPPGDFGTLVSVLISAFAFAVYHQAATPFLFFFALAMAVGIYWRKSIAFALGAHFVLNFFLA